MKRNISTFWIFALALAIVGLALQQGCQAEQESQQAKQVKSSKAKSTPVAYTPKPVTSIETDKPKELPVISQKFVPSPDEPLVEMGTKAFREKDYDRALAYFQARVDQVPQDAWSNYMLGLTQWKVGDLESAAGTLTVAAELNEESIRARVNLARVQNARGKFEEALGAAKEALMLDQENASARFLEARTLHNLGRFDETLASLDESLKYDDTNGYAFNLKGLTLIKLGQFENAKHALEQAASLLPEVAFVHNNLGLALERTGDVDAAKVAFKRATECQGGHVGAENHLARLGVNTAVSDSGELSVEAMGDPSVPETSEPVTKTDG